MCVRQRTCGCLPFYVKFQKPGEKLASSSDNWFLSFFRPRRDATEYMSTRAKYYGMDGSLVACEWENSTNLLSLFLAILAGLLVSVSMNILAPILVRARVS